MRDPKSTKDGVAQRKRGSSGGLKSRRKKRPPTTFAAKRRLPAAPQEPLSPPLTPLSDELQQVWEDLLDDRLQPPVDAIPTAGSPPETARRRELEKLWVAMDWPVAARDDFRKSPAYSTQEGVVREVARLTELKSLVSDVLNKAMQRETRMAQLLLHLDSCPPYLLPPPPPESRSRRDHDRYVTRLAYHVQLLRRANVEVLEGLGRWRKATSATPPFAWRGVVYACKMLEDLKILSAHPIARNFLRPEILSSPLLHSGEEAGAATRTARLQRLRAAKAILANELLLSNVSLQTIESLRCEAAQKNLPHSTASSPRSDDGKVSSSQIMGASTVFPFASSASHSPDVLDTTHSALARTITAPPANAGATAVASESSPIHLRHLISPDTPSIKPPGSDPATPAGTRQGMDLKEMIKQELEEREEEEEEGEEGEEEEVDEGEEEAVGGEEEEEVEEVEEEEEPPICDVRVDCAVRRLQRFFRVRCRAVHQEFETSLEAHPWPSQPWEEGTPAASRSGPPSPQADTSNPLRVVSPAWARHAGTSHPLTFTSVAAWKHAAASAIQRFWSLRTEAAKATKRLRDDRDRLRAAEVLWYHWRHRDERRMARDAREVLCERYTRKRLHEAGALQRYEAARRALQRVGRGQLGRGVAFAAMVRAVDAERQRSSMILTRLARGMLGRRKSRRARMEREQRLEAARDDARRAAAACKIQSCFRGHLAYKHRDRERENLRVFALLDVDHLRARAVLVLQRWYRRSYTKRFVLHPLALARNAARERQREAEREWWSAVRIQAVWRGWSTRSTVRKKIQMRTARRRKYIPHAGERYRGVVFDDLHIAKLAEEANANWALLHNRANHTYASEIRRRRVNEPVDFSPERRRAAYSRTHSLASSPIPTSRSLHADVDKPIEPHDLRPEGKGHVTRGSPPASRPESRGSVHRDETSEEEQSSHTMPLDEDEEEHDVSAFMSTSLDPLTRYRHRLRMFLMCVNRSGIDISIASVLTIADFLVADIEVNGVRIQRLDLSLVMRQEEDGTQAVCNNLLRLPRSLLRSMLIAVYSGAPPNVHDKWSLVVVLGRVVVEWGIHAAVSHFNDVPIEGGTLLDLILMELELDGAAQLMAYIRKDPTQLLHDPALSVSTIEIIQQTAPRVGEDFALTMWELGLLQVLSVQTEESLAALLSTLDVPLKGSRDEAEQLAARALVV